MAAKILDEYCVMYTEDLRTLDQNAAFMVNVMPTRDVLRKTRTGSKMIGKVQDLYTFYRHDLQQYFWDSDFQSGDHIFEAFVTDRTQNRDRLTFSFRDERDHRMKYVNLCLNLKNRTWYDRIFKESVEHIATPVGTSVTLLRHVLIRCHCEFESGDDTRKNYGCTVSCNAHLLVRKHDRQVVWPTYEEWEDVESSFVRK